MQIQVFRQASSARSTLGEMHIDGQFECFTLEDVVRPVKVKGMTAIPAGSYEVIISFSERFKRLLPLLLNVPNFDGVRIHAGNTDADTEGCLLVGQTQSADFIGKSRAAFDQLFAKLQAASAREKIFIEIVALGAPATAAPVTARPPVRVAMTRPLTRKAAPVKAAKPASGKKKGKSN